jgi:hypothetical protein
MSVQSTSNPYELNKAVWMIEVKLLHFCEKSQFKIGLEDAGLVMEFLTRRCTVLQGTAGTALVVNAMSAVQPLKELQLRMTGNLSQS